MVSVSGAKVLYEDETFHLVLWKNLLYSHLTGAMTASHARALCEAQRTAAAFSPEQICSVSVIGPNVPVAPTDVRAIINEGLRDPKVKVALKATAMVLEARGAMATMLRTILQGISVITGSPLHPVADLPSAIKAVARYVPGSTPEAIGAALEQLRAEEPKPAPKARARA